jgi:hypothetical protein
VADIALFNFLVTDNQLKLTDFGQSILFPLTADVNTICDNDLTAQIETLHLSWMSTPLLSGIFTTIISLTEKIYIGHIQLRS